MPGPQVGPQSLQQLLDAVLAISSDLDLTAVLHRIVEAAVSLVDARYGALGVLDDTGTRLGQFLAVGIDDETRAAIGHVPRGIGILGLLIEDARPLRLAEIREHPASVGFPPNHPPMHSFLGVPIRVGGRVFGNLYLTEKKTGAEFTEVDEELVLGLATAAGIAISNAEVYEERRRRSTERAGLQEIASAMLTGRDTRDILEIVAARAREILQGDLATIVLPEVGDDVLTIEVAVGSDADELVGRHFAPENTITGQVLDTGAAVVVDDLACDHRTGQPHVQLGTLGPAVFVPLGTSDQTIGSLSIARAVGAPPFTLIDLEGLQQFATQATLVFGQGRRNEDLHRLSLLEDQERIARDLHDTVIQRLFATGLSLQGAARLIRDDEARQRVEAAVEDLDTTVRQIRTVIFDIEASANVASVRRRVMQVARGAARSLGFQPRVIFLGPVDTGIPPEVVEDLLPTLQEALSNVARHAHARSVLVDLSVSSDITLRVIDDGIGPRSEGRPAGYGLANMRARAAQHGGRFEVQPGPERGTVLEWSVPRS
jgi:signal transduction histidine kinase